MLLGGRCVTLRFCSVMSSQKMGVDGFAVLRLRVSRWVEVLAWEMKRIRVPNLLFCNAYSNTNLSKTFRLDSIYSACESIGVQPGHYDKLSLAKNHQLTSTLEHGSSRVLYSRLRLQSANLQRRMNRIVGGGFLALKWEKETRWNREKRKVHAMPTQWKMVKHS